MHFDMKQLSRVATAFVLAAVFALPQIFWQKVPPT